MEGCTFLDHQLSSQRSEVSYRVVQDYASGRQLVLPCLLGLNGISVIRGGWGIGCCESEMDLPLLPILHRLILAQLPFGDHSGNRVFRRLAVSVVGMRH